MSNRIIKFRVFDKILKHYIIPWQGIGYDDIDLIYSNGGNWFIAGGNILDDRYILQQFTGVLDINGKEIYEGDIIKIKAHYLGDNYIESSIDEVEFNDGSFCCKSDDINTINVINYNISVVGNINN